jgi:hypothetical protein
MGKHWSDVLNAIIDKQPQELVGVIMITLMVSIACAGIYNLARTKTSDKQVLLSGLMLLACLASVTLIFGFTYQPPRRMSPANQPPFAHIGPPMAGPHGPPMGSPHNFEMFAANFVMEATDANHDGFLSADELTDFVRANLSDNDESVDAYALAKALRSGRETHLKALPPDARAPSPPPNSQEVSTPANEATQVPRRESWR